MIVLAALTAVALATLPVPTEDAPTAMLGETALSYRLPLDEETQQALATRDHAAAIAGLKRTDTRAYSGRQVSDHHLSLIHI